ncbi:MAG: ABC transporter substrate-binding protein [Planctomycetota bacterium]
MNARLNVFANQRVATTSGDAQLGRKIMGIVLLVVSGWGLTACSGGSAARNADRGSSSGSATGEQATLVYGRAGDANTLDPINTDIGESVKVIVNVFDTLVTYHQENLELVPSLATKWSRSEDGLTWTFTLREGVRFHDGEVVNAAAVVFSFERLIGENHPAVYDPARPYQPNYKMIDRVAAPDEQTVVFQLKEPSAIFLNNLAMFPASVVSPKSVEKLGKQFATNPVGSGPFKFARWKRDQQIVLEAFPDYWDGKPEVQRVIFLPIAEAATRVQQLKQGTIHFAEDLPPTELDAVATLPGITIQEQVALNVGYLTLQTEKPPLNNLKVRQAIGHAINKAELVKVVYAGHAKPAVNMVPPAMWGHHDQLADRAYDLAAAKRLLAEAAKEDGFTLPVKLRFSIMSQPRPYMQQPLQTATLIKDSLAQIGIELTVDPRPISQHFEHLMAGRHELGLAGWTTDNSDPDNFLYSLLDSDNISEHGNNLSRYRNEEVHRLLTAAQRELDTDKRLEMYHRAQELCLADVPVVPLVHTEIRLAQRSNVQGYRLHPGSLVRLRWTRLAAEASR